MWPPIGDRIDRVGHRIAARKQAENSVGVIASISHLPALVGPRMALLAQDECNHVRQDEHLGR